jgi:uncharacterized protein YigA (DUF484 family)
MTTQANVDTRIGDPDAAQISEFLRDHPDFFDTHQDLLAELRLPHSSGKAVSLIERQVQVLREQNETLKSRLLELVNVARENDRLSGRMHQMTLDLLAASSLVGMLDALEDHLRNEFKADVIALHLPGLSETQLHESGAENLVVNETLKELLPTPLCEGKPQCGRLKQQQLDFLFKDQAAAIESTAVIPIGHHGQGGLLAIGSREVNRFNPCMGTLFLSHLGELLSRMLQKHTAG